MDAGPFLDPVLEYVKQIGGSSILITYHQAAGFSHRADHQFHLMRGADQTYRTLTTPTALSYAFELAIFHLDPARCAKALSTFDDLASRFGGGSSPWATAAPR